MNIDRQAIIDAEHLRLLSIFHFVAAGLAMIGGGFASLYFVMFQLIFANPEIWAQSEQGAPPEQMMTFFRSFLLGFMLWFLIAAVGNLLSGLFMRGRRHRVFSMVVAGINCLHIPIGTLLGVFTFIVLSRDSVRKMYEEVASHAKGV
ncbi:MAG TPA: hypothetical protein VFL84_04195 [Gammaproteobacteria bacterium]|nr:hypothetical protein [Gammaproteobacteria bacterium]